MFRVIPWNIDQWAEPDLNRRPSHFQCDALPTELSTLFVQLDFQLVFPVGFLRQDRKRSRHRLRVKVTRLWPIEPRFRRAMGKAGVVWGGLRLVMRAWGILRLGSRDALMTHEIGSPETTSILTNEKRPREGPGAWCFDSSTHKPRGYDLVHHAINSGTGQACTDHQPTR